MSNKQPPALNTLSFSPENTRFLQLLSVIYEPVGITKLISCAKSFGLTQKNSNQHTPQSLKKILLPLIEQHIVLLNEDNKQYSCHPSLVDEIAKQAISDGVFVKLAQVVRNIIPVPHHQWRGTIPSSWPQAVREVRIAFYMGHEQQTQDALILCEQHFARQYYNESPLAKLCFSPFDPELFSKLPPLTSANALLFAFNSGISPSKINTNEVLTWVIDALENHRYTLHPAAYLEITKYLILKGKLDAAKKIIFHAPDYEKNILQGWLFCLAEKDNDAIQSFEHALTLLKKNTRKRKIFIGSLSGIFFLLSLFRRGSQEDVRKIGEYIDIAKKANTLSPVIINTLSQLLAFVKGSNSNLYYLQSLPKWPANRTAFEYFILVLVLYWTDKSAAKKHQKELARCVKEIKNSDYQWLYAESTELLSRLDKTNAKKHARIAEKVRDRCGFESLVDVIKTKEPWERALDAMSNLDRPQKKNTPQKKSRLIWILSSQHGELGDVLVKEQKQNAKGGWSVGRQIALKRLLEDRDSFDSLTEQDIRASKGIISSRDYWGISYDIDPATLLPLLVGHPLLFSSTAQNTPLDLSKGSPEIQVIKKGNHLTIKMVPAIDEYTDYLLIKETETHWKVIESTPEQRQLASLIGDKLKIPIAAKERVLASMNAIAPFVDIHSDIGGGVIEAENIEADSTLHMLLSPLEDGLKIEARTQIFGNKGPYYHPGVGGKTVIAEVEGKRLQATRDIKKEIKNLSTILTQCPQLNQVDMSNDEWSVLDPEACLEVLLELHSQDSAIISWPEGEKLKIHQTIGLSDFKMVIKKQNDWFSASGEIKLDDGQVLNMQRLMALTRSSKGRFISLAEGQFIALTDTFKSRISELAAFGEAQDDSIKLHPLAALALDGMANEVGKLKSDKGWKTYISRFHEAMELTPEVPSTLQAELRDYQKDGFQWLVRLAHWGVGACLADDMGLGKTVQAIALLLHRAKNGPALVVAPTSVAMNWMDEIARFSPTLNIIDYRESKRATALKNVDAFDIVICSYGLIQSNIEKIESVNWSTLILDEAQAIKNSATKRSQAIMRLQADVKIAMTGTPIENHLGELWNLFRFINPGLLGSMESFNSRYANPIVRDESIDTRQKLKKLIHPYILRRTKTQVLKELPSRTEITLQVEMSKDETALYEALRREAVEKFTESDLPKGHRQLQILAEITRLRRACCNPALVLKAGAPASSKLALFVNVVQELLDNHHKALVFSQFVDHLTILKNKLEEMNVSYQYLDGSTPAKQRKKRVTDFQSGIGDIFLISLKAGGVGLNLTAADYVIHMDPWWNPAVEDQASDRAHRIGQTRPVTVYRMITKNTIEEKIVALHKGKRDLADNLLAGTEVANKVNVEELLNLLQEN